MKTVQACTKQLLKKLDNLTKSTKLYTPEAEAQEIWSTMQQNRIKHFKFELTEVLDIVGYVEGSYSCEIVPKSQFDKIIETSEICSLEFEGIYFKLALCYRFPLENPFLLICSSSIEEILKIDG